MALLTSVQAVYWPKKLKKSQILTQCNDTAIILFHSNIYSHHLW